MLQQIEQDCAVGGRAVSDHLHSYSSAKSRIMSLLRVVASRIWFARARLDISTLYFRGIVIVDWRKRNGEDDLTNCTRRGVMEQIFLAGGLRMVAMRNESYTSRDPGVP